jgi:hypothetical protein
MKISDMRKILLLLMPFLALATGCLRDDLGEGRVTPGSGDDVSLTVRVDVPAAKTREAIGAATIGENGLWMMVFSQTGTYLAKYKGELNGGDGNYSNYIFRGIPVSNGMDEGGNTVFRSRTLHFVANYDFSDFNDADYRGDAESSLLSGMTVDGGTVAYWQRVVLEDGFYDEGNMTLPDNRTVHLLRNAAEITVKNNTAGNETSLTDVEFVVGNYFDKGSVAPYNMTGSVFGDGYGDDFVMEALDGAPVAIDGTTPFTAEGTFKQIYERENSSADEDYPATYVIVRGYFEGSGAYSYYKIDIADNDAKELIDLQRNRKYTININGVFNDGHDNLADAINGAASNNIEANTVVGDYPSISDGGNVLEVQATSFVYTVGGGEYTIWYRYTTYDEEGNGTVDNDLEETPVLVQTDGQLVIAEGSLTVDAADAPGQTYRYIRFRTAALPTRVNDAAITISKGILSRTIELQLRPIMDFIIVRAGYDNTDDRAIPNFTHTPVNITFKFPENISKGIFPIPVRIYAKKITPTPTSGMSLGTGGGEFWYVYNAEAQYDADGNFLPTFEYRLDFVSNSRDTDEIVTLAAERFQNATVDFDNGPNRDFTVAEFRTNKGGATGWTADNAKPRQVAGTNTDMRVYFSLPAEFRNTGNVTVTFVAPYLDLETGNGDTSGGLTVTSNGGNANNRVYTITVNTNYNGGSTGEFYFTVQNNSTNAANRSSAKTFQAEFFNSVNLNN